MSLLENRLAADNIHPKSSRLIYCSYLQARRSQSRWNLDFSRKLVLGHWESLSTNAAIAGWRIYVSIIWQYRKYHGG